MIQDNTRQILSEVADILEQKNHDYGGAFDLAFDEIGPMYAVGKIFEKYRRINTLSKTEAHVKGEGLKDALQDCIGYCARYLNRLEQPE